MSVQAARQACFESVLRLMDTVECFSKSRKKLLPPKIQKPNLDLIIAVTTLISTACLMSSSSVYAIKIQKRKSCLHQRKVWLRGFIIDLNSKFHVKYQIWMPLAASLLALWHRWMIISWRTNKQIYLTYLEFHVLRRYWYLLTEDECMMRKLLNAVKNYITTQIFS